MRFNDDDQLGNLPLLLAGLYLFSLQEDAISEDWRVFLKLIMLLMFTFTGRTEENTFHFLAVSLYKNSHHCAVNKAALPCPSHSEVEALFVSPKRTCSKDFCYMQNGIIIN